MDEVVRLGVVGAGVAGLSAATHLLELWEARRLAGLLAPRLELSLVASLALDPGGDGSGLGGKAMSRSFVGPADRHGNLRALFYGPMLPHQGTIPHGYHVMWEYPNVRRMLGDGALDEGSPPFDGGLMRPKGGGGLIAIFQGNVDDPTPGGPGIARMGLSDPALPSTATRPATRALYRLLATPLARVFWAPFHALFGELVDLVESVHPLFFSDLFYTHEVDLEMRLALIAASLIARSTDPERTTVRVGDEDKPLWAVEYNDYVHSEIVGWAKRLRTTLDRPPLSALTSELSARSWLLEAQIETYDEDGLSGLARALLPDAVEPDVEAALLLTRETERVLRGVPAALLRLAGGTYPVDRTLHLRFGPDGTFTSPYSFDAAQSLRSLAFVFTTPKSARVWTPDGAHIQRLWVRMWERLQALADRNRDVATLQIHKGRATHLIPRPEGGVTVTWGGWLGHGLGMVPASAEARGSDLSYPHTASLDPTLPPPRDPASFDVDAVIAAAPAPLLRDLLPEDSAARAALDPLRGTSNATLELLIWTRERIVYGEAAAAGLAVSSITGLEGGYCLLADYSQGLWSPEALAAEDPFGDGKFAGSILESCGGFDDLFAAMDRDDAFGWPAEVKEVLAGLVCRRDQFSAPDLRRWTADESGWEKRRTGGTWTPERAADPAAMEDWWVAARWMAWQFLRQLSCVAALGAQAVRQLRYYAELIDPHGLTREDILHPPEALLDEVRYVAMINAKARGRIFSPGAGLWPLRPVSGAELPGAPGVYPAGDWTRNGLDIVCMEAACLSGMRAARGVYADRLDEAPPSGAPDLKPVLPPKSWYHGLDPMARPGDPIGSTRRRCC